MWLKEAGIKGRRRSGRKGRVCALRKYYTNPKRCLCCNQIIRVRIGEQPATTRKKKFCNHRCAAIYSNKRRQKCIKRNPLGICWHCGERTIKDTLFCGAYCYREYKYKTYITEWLKGKQSGNTLAYGNVVNHVRRYLFEKANNKCVKCGWNKINQTSGKIPLTINHINGNAFDSRPENLELLCPNCHSLTSNFKTLNYGNGRGARRKRGECKIAL